MNDNQVAVGCLVTVIWNQRVWRDRKGLFDPLGGLWSSVLWIMRATLRQNFFYSQQITSCKVFFCLIIVRLKKQSFHFQEGITVSNTHTHTHTHINDRFCALSKNQTRPSEVSTRLERPNRFYAGSCGSLKSQCSKWTSLFNYSVIIYIYHPSKNEKYWLFWITAGTVQYLN